MQQPVFITLDGATTRDIDDAFWLTRHDAGFSLQIAIAHVADCVPADSDLDRQARARAETVYAGAHVRQAMLPGDISEDRSSLVARMPRASVVYTIKLAANLAVTAFEVEERTIEVAARLGYEDIPDVTGDGAHPLGEQVRLGCELGRALYAQRRHRGALAFFDAQRLLLADEDGSVLAFRSQAEMHGHILVQEFMILTNRLCAEFMLEHDIPALYRNHARRVGAPEAVDLTAALPEWAATLSDDEIRSRLALLSGAATYGPHATGHYALALPAYMHVTSPLRRYADLFNQRMLVAYLRGDARVDDAVARSELAEHLNTVIREHRMQREAWFRQRILDRGRAALDAQAVSKLSDTELTQALKLVQAGEVVPTQLADEVTRRLHNGSAPDKLVYSVFVRLMPIQLTPSLGDALAAWFHTRPSMSQSLLQHLQMRDRLTGPDIRIRASTRGFEAVASAVPRDRERIETAGTGTTRKQAEQMAALQLVLRLLDLPGTAASSPLASESAAAATENSKGALLEYCQKRRLAAPEFSVTSSGPSNAALFVCEVVVTGRGQICSGSGRGGTRKAAEQAAAADLLARLRITDDVDAADESQVSSGDNAIGQLQTAMQRQRYGMPQYRFTPGGPGEPAFCCDVTFGQRQALSARGHGTTKKAAKAMAAEQALARLAAAAGQRQDAASSVTE